MNFGLGKVASGLPALLGVLLGIRVYSNGSCWTVACIGMLLIAGAAVFAGRSMLHIHPRFGGWLIELCILAPVAIVALATVFIIWLSLEPPSVLVGNASDPETQKVLSGAFLGAVGTYIAFVWTKDIADATGFFWPSTQFKKGMEQAYTSLQTKPQNASKEQEAMFDDVVVGIGRIGWNFSARRQRADILAQFLRQD